jgi:large subunit ribosomal protein L1
MSRKSKRLREAREKVDRGRSYGVDEALDLVKNLATARYKESVDVSVNLGVDPRKSDQVVRGSTVLPHGTGKSVRVAVFAQGPAADAAREAGADIVGFEDLADEVKGGSLNFDVAVAAPDAMRVVGPLGKILGPRGLMPNPKVGTVTPDVAGAVKKAKAGQVQYRTDRAGIIHSTIGKANFDVSSLRANLEALVVDLNKAKPSTSKGVYIKKIAVSTTQGPGVSVDKASLSVQ